jgi:protein-tyrosine phosphatase
MTLYWIERTKPGRIAIMARPRAGDWLADELARWCAEGVDTVVSLLEAEEVVELGLEDEMESCIAAGMTFRTFPIPDRGVPTPQSAVALARELAVELDAGHAIAIHCRAGIGRSSVIAALVLIVSGEPPAEVFDRISTARRLEVPDTSAQREWVLSVAAALADTPLAS